MRPFLVDSLYLLALHLGSPVASIANSANQALLSVATACELASVAELIGANADYLINDIALKVK